MVASLSDTQAEALLAGSVGSDGDLESVAVVLATVRDLAQPDADADFSALFAAAARESRVTPIERFANEQFTSLRGRRPQLVQRVAFATAALLMFVAMSNGLAYAADGAKPGDLMYGLDRAFEAVGFSNGGATERLVEVEALFAAGAVADALQHATAVLDGHPANDEARAALSAAAERFVDNADSPGSRAVEVGALITYLQTALASSNGVDGQMVAGIVRDLGTSQADPAGPPTEPGSQSDPAGPPAEPGSKADPAGPPTEPGSKADPAGPPTEPGSPSSDTGFPEQGRKEK